MELFENYFQVLTTHAAIVRIAHKQWIQCYNTTTGSASFDADENFDSNKKWKCISF